MTGVTKLLKWYEEAIWIRALVQLPPGGGSIDVLLSGKAASINQQRLDELLEEISTHLERLGEEKLNKDFLASEEFFEIFRTAAEIVAHSANAEKRQLVAAYLSGTISNSVITDLSSQVLEDIRLMQPIHFQVLLALPIEENQSVSKQKPLQSIAAMPISVYEKAMSDLEKLGFICFNNNGIGGFGGGGGGWVTTGYVHIFREHIQS